MSSGSRPPRRHTVSALTMALSACLIGSSVGAAQAAPSSTPSTPQVTVRDEETPRFVPERARTLHEGRRLATQSTPGREAAAGQGFQQVPTGQECPTGSKRQSTIFSHGFENNALPSPSDSDGWSVVSGAARTGSFSARSVIKAADPSTQPTARPYWQMTLPILKTAGGRTVVRFGVKGDYLRETAMVAVNGASGWAAPATEWGTITLDVTDAIAPSDAGNMDIRFGNYPKVTATDSTIDIDDIEVYSCSNASAVRGDYTGDGVADLLTVNSSGVLQIWPGTGDLHLGSPLTAGSGWELSNYLGSAGDLNGDGHADILARFTNGDLIVYYGNGQGGFNGSQRVGNGWGGINSITPMGDINGDGLPDFLARDVAGNMRRYWLASIGGALTGGTVVGVGFNNFTSLFSMGDFDGDGRFDLTGILTNGDMRVYTTLATGALWGGGQKIGNGWGFRQVTSPGDLNRDGRPDILGLDYAGNILGYPVLGGGRWGTTTLTGSGFGAFRLIG
ncbi:Repeat domain-containing protein [Austwickia chelonae]|uniref:VCBS repeat-containing protein n=1 Tax=Austwickia chelonae NBRC 105200 TaxID=1184607 RepID=K6VSL2_9MICO|nr:VCBS repeat-containing protein [Austwickia chelonae]GAB78330.1 hypothetical protein AUCHE_08_05770 [Austwickia chelonae NBRC 105200]SEW01428.1 Repeat domain-containing protein [Austwickia chelonae]